MRKFLISILTVILIILAYFVVTDGITIGTIRILSWNDLIENNNKLDSEIENLEVTLGQIYPQEQAKLNESYKQLNIKKDEYADLILYSSENEIAAATQTEIYETEFLWTKLGNYATKNNGIDMKIEVVNGTSGQPNIYNLKFTLVGEYAYISDFISSVENDAKLSFRIDNFLLVPANIPTDNETTQNNKKQENTTSGNSQQKTQENEKKEEKNENLLQATFTVENVGIKIDNANSNVTTESEVSTTNNTNSNQ